VTLNTLGASWQARLEQLIDGLRPQLAATHFIAPTEKDWRDACAYLDLLVTWNKQLDLTAANDDDALVELIFADAFVLGSFAANDGAWLDVGSGAGAPGVALSVFRSDLSLTLAEPLQKRVAFLRAVCGTLPERKLTVQRTRAEALEAARWDATVSRATFEPAEWLQHGSRLARREVWVLLARAEPPELDGWQPGLDVTYRWPRAGVPRRAVKYVPKIR
jgi:16S rRNA (guanine527-N7)-methyltransferase